jgi:putative hydrolase of the HAD superfamily
MSSDVFRYLPTSSDIFRRVKALLVDLYDTLIRTDWHALGQWMTARLDVDGQILLRAFEATSEARGTGRYGSIRGDLAAIIAATGGTADESFLGTLETELVALVGERTHLYGDVRPALRTLRASGVRVAIVSNCDHSTRPLLDKLELEREVDATVLSFEVGSLKPDAAIFDHALARLGATARDAVFIDDQARFLDGALSLGIRTLRIVRATSYGGIADPGPHPVIADLTQLTEL